MNDGVLAVAESPSGRWHAFYVGGNDYSLCHCDAAAWIVIKADMARVNCLSCRKQLQKISQGKRITS